MTSTWQTTVVEPTTAPQLGTAESVPRLEFDGSSHFAWPLGLQLLAVYSRGRFLSVWFMSNEYVSGGGVCEWGGIEQTRSGCESVLGFRTSPELCGRTLKTITSEIQNYGFV